MLRISKADIVALNQGFRIFKKEVVNTPKIQPSFFIGRLNKFEKLYKKAGMIENFADMIFIFAENLVSAGLDDFAGIIYSSLMKLPIKNNATKEKYTQRSLEFYRQRGDSIHVLSRIIDLKKMYLSENRIYKYTTMLLQEEKELAKICENFSSAKQNYKTYNKKKKPLESYELMLARTRVEIAKLIHEEVPDKAREYLEKARKTLSKYSKEKDIAFIDSLLRKKK